MRKTEKDDHKKPQILHFDKIRINSYEDVRYLHRLLPKSELSKESHYFKIGEASDIARMAYFKSKMEVVVPSTKCLEILKENILSLDSFISYVEVARDTIYRSENEAELMFKSFAGYLRKKYSYKTELYVHRGKIDYKKGFFSYKTNYCGQYGFRYVIYPRYSKINGQPCLHEEWRIVGASTIKRKTGIESISDLITFDFEAFFARQDKQYIIYEEIDDKKLARWMMGLSRKKKLTKRQKIRIDINGRFFLNVYEISNYSDLVNFFKKIKSELKATRGRKNKWENKILSLNNYEKFKRPYNNIL